MKMRLMDWQKPVVITDSLTLEKGQLPFALPGAVRRKPYQIKVGQWPKPVKLLKGQKGLLLLWWFSAGTTGLIKNAMMGD